MTLDDLGWSWMTPFEKCFFLHAVHEFNALFYVKVQRITTHVAQNIILLF